MLVHLPHHKRHVHAHGLSLDLAALDDDLLLRDPGAFHLIDAVGGARHTGEDRVLEAFGAGCADFNDLGDRHGFLLG